VGLGLHAFVVGEGGDQFCEDEGHFVLFLKAGAVDSFLAVVQFGEGPSDKFLVVL
jgi:hypothetical protein